MKFKKGELEEKCRDAGVATRFKLRSVDATSAFDPSPAVVVFVGGEHEVIPATHSVKLLIWHSFACVS